MNLFTRLMNNHVTSNIILSQLTDTIHRNLFTHQIYQVCQQFNINIFEFIIQHNINIHLPYNHEVIDENIKNILKNTFEFWHVKEQRNLFKQILEENIPLLA